MEPTEHSGAARAGVQTYVVEAVVAAMIVLMGLVVVFGSRKLGAGWTTDGPGAGYFPFYIGVILCIAGAGIFCQALFTRQKNTGIFVDNEQLRRVLQVLVPALVYVGAVQFLGLYLASAIYIALFMVYLGHYTWFKSAVAAAVVVTLFFFMFEVWFKVPLFKGTLDPLRFLGY